MPRAVYSSSSSSSSQASTKSSTVRLAATSLTGHKRKAAELPTVSRLTTSLLQKQLKQLAKGAVDGVEVWLPEDDLLHWGLTIEGPPDTLYEGGLFRAELNFPVTFPDQPPNMKFTGKQKGKSFISSLTSNSLRNSMKCFSVHSLHKASSQVVYYV